MNVFGFIYISYIFYTNAFMWNRVVFKHHIYHFILTWAIAQPSANLANFPVDKRNGLKKHSEKVKHYFINI